MLITCQKSRQSGFTLIELFVGVIILGILTSLAVPSFQVMIRNTQVRNAAEAVADGLQRARAEAVSRNTNVEFVMGIGSSWTIKVAGVGGIEIDSRSSSEGSKHASVTPTPAGATIITFNNLGGRVAVNADGSAPFTQIDFDTLGADRPLRVTIGIGGNARMCDPHLLPGHTGAC